MYCSYIYHTLLKVGETSVKEKFLNAIYSNEGVTESIKVDCIKCMKGLNGQ